MPATIHYFFSPVSPWTYLGHERFAELAERNRAEIRVKPVDLGKVFAVSGGLPVKQRAPQRQAYRLIELARWRDHLRLPLSVQPKYFPVPQDAACRFIVAAQAESERAAMRLAGAFMKACWAEERNLADETTLRAIATEQGFDAHALAAAAAKDAVGERYAAFTAEAIEKEVFGSPTYIVDGEPFWGQDRLDFVERKLAREKGSGSSGRPL
jgi:2-hydroxychromene-2-carboxylate isomerase